MCIGIIKRILLLPLILLSLFSSGQVELSNNSEQQLRDTSLTHKDSTRVRYYINTTDSLTLDKLHDVDTSLINTQVYDPLKALSPFNISLGNTGLAAYNQFFAPAGHIGFRYQANVFDAYMFRNNKIKYYDVIKPYTLLKYANGPEKEQLFRLTHSQKLFGRFGFGIDFRFLQSFGTYDRQKSDDKSLCLKLQYFTDNKRYGVIANYIHDKVIVEENGGILYDSIFEQNIETDRRLYKVKLENATNTVKYANIFLNQYFFLSKPSPPLPDSLDSTAVSRKKSWFHLGKLSHSFLWKRDQYLFEDSDPLNEFYQFGPFIDSTLTNDTNYVTTIENDFSWSNLGPDDQPEDKPVYLFFGIKHLLTQLGDSAKTNTFQQLIPYGGFSVFVLKSFRLNFDLSLVLGDYNGGDIAAKAQIQQYLGNKYRNLGMLVVDAKYFLQEPDYFFTKYHGNNFWWDNSFKQQEIIVGKASYNYKNLTAGVVLNQLKNYVFLNTEALPEQKSASFSVLQGFINKSFNWGDFAVKTKLIYQKSTNEEVISLPDFAGFSQISYTKAVFNNAATIQPGVSAYYNTSSFTPRYMPTLRSFYHNNEIKTGNYLIINVFFNVKIKRTRLFATYQHINAPWTGYNYIGIPHYPLQDGAFKFGLYWKFWD